MSYYSRLQKSFEGACRLPLNQQTAYVLFSDCHRGVGTSNDNFLKNRPLFMAALQYYYRRNFTYIELGDGDELWENRSLSQIIEIHSDVFELLSRFFRQGRLYMLYGNHDMVKKNRTYTSRCCNTYPRFCGNNLHLQGLSLFPDIPFHSGIILENRSREGGRDIYLTHGHQVDLLNSTFWRLSRFLVRYLWRPLEHFGVLDPTSAAKNYKRKEKAEQRLQSFARQKNQLLITGHTHRPYLSPEDPYYCNSGSCVHPHSITCLEIRQMNISLVKWALTARPDMSLSVSRQILAGPISLNSLRTKNSSVDSCAL